MNLSTGRQKTLKRALAYTDNWTWYPSDDEIRGFFEFIEKGVETSDHGALNLVYGHNCASGRMRNIWLDGVFDREAPFGFGMILRDYLVDSVINGIEYWNRKWPAFEDAYKLSCHIKGLV